MKLLGPSFDLHLGGEDLVFPHHEDEIAQSEGRGRAGAGPPFVKYWLHGAHLLVEGKKMSKSLGNYFTLRDLLAKGFTGREIRYLLLTAHYRESFNFTLEGLRGARAALARLDECLAKLRETAGDATAPPRPLCSPSSLPRWTTTSMSPARGARFLTGCAKTTGFGPRQSLAGRAPRPPWRHGTKWIRFWASSGPDESAVPTELQALLESAQAARKAKDFKRADAIRDELKSQRLGHRGHAQRPATESPI